MQSLSLCFFVRNEKIRVWCDCASPETGMSVPHMRHQWKSEFSTFLRQELTSFWKYILTAITSLKLPIESHTLPAPPFPSTKGCCQCYWLFWQLDESPHCWRHTYLFNMGKNLLLNWKLHPFWIVCTVREGVIHATRREKESLTSLSYEPADCNNDLHIIYAHWYSVRGVIIHFLIGFKACFVSWNPSLTL